MWEGSRKYVPEQWALQHQTAEMGRKGCVLMRFILRKLSNFSLPAFSGSPPPPPPLFLLVALLVVHLVLLGFPSITWPTLICSSCFQSPCPFLVYKAAHPHVTSLFWVFAFAVFVSLAASEVIVASVNYQNCSNWLHEVKIVWRVVPLFSICDVKQINQLDVFFDCIVTSALRLPLPTSASLCW